MSNYQYIYFAAVDKPLDDNEFEFMAEQSTRAALTRWEFQNEYHFGDFHGDSLEMMRTGFDVHLHYANFGVRKLMFRLPMGLPVSAKEFKAFAVENEFVWKKDKRGKGGVLSIQPESDGDEFAWGYVEFDGLVAQLPKIREALIAGDTRPLYLGWLACAWDGDALEPPVPAGLNKLSPSLSKLASFYEMDQDLLEAISEKSAKLPRQSVVNELSVDDWLEQQSSEMLRSLLRRVLQEDPAAVRAESLAAMRNQAGKSVWPATPGSRTLEEIYDLASVKEDQREKRELASEQRKRTKRLAILREDPMAAIAKVERLVQTRRRANYAEAAKLLAELREAVGGVEGERLADKVASRIVTEYPTLHSLKRAFQDEGLSYR
ncbi:MAG: hypothetical protein KDB14_15365 [Planctomycetales bacterium]|nr:hypothetical protein [Planctomycetales bacterium]